MQPKPIHCTGGEDLPSPFRTFSDGNKSFSFSWDSMVNKQTPFGEKTKMPYREQHMKTTIHVMPMATKHQVDYNVQALYAGLPINPWEELPS
jgi:hypothetical protein